MSGIKKFLPSVLMILLGIAVGVMLIIDAVRLTEIVFRIFGIALIVLSVVLVIRYLIDRKHEEETVMTLVMAVIAFVIGMVFAIGAKMIVEAGSTLCAIFYGAVMFVNGILKIAEYFSLKKQGFAVSGIRIVSGIFSIALGVVTVVLCSQALHIIGVIVGISLIVNAILDTAALAVAHRLNRSNSLYDTSGDDEDYDLE